MLVRLPYVLRNSLIGLSAVLETDIFQHFTFVILGDLPYKSHGVSVKHLVAQRLAMQYNVLYIEPPAKATGAFSWRREPESVKPGDRIAEAEYNLKIVCPPACGMPFGARIKGMDGVHQWLFGRWLRNLLADLDVSNFILWSFRYNSGTVMQILRPDVAIYHAIGRRAEEPIGMENKSLIDELEVETMKTAHVVFTSSELMYEQISRIKRETYYSPFGVDYKLFHTALRTDLKVPEDLEKIPEPRVGYVGVLEHWLDIGLIEYVVSGMPDVSFVFIGRYGPWQRVEKLMNYPNVHLLGSRPRGTLPAYLRWMDACIIPFKINELTLHSNPMKIYEYLAAGKPVVSTPIHEVAKFADFIEIADTKPEFVSRLRRAITDRDINRANARAEIARHYSWTQRIAEMLDQISGLVVGADERPW